MENEFTGAMSGRTDEQLIKIVTIERDDYQASAIQAAEHEIAKRKIDSAKIEELKMVLITKLDESKAFDARKVSSSTRLLHYLIDTIAFVLVAMVLSFVLDLFYKTNNPAVLNLVIIFLLIISVFSYYIIMENKYQKTLGKYLTKTKVVTTEGLRPEAGDIVRRTLCRLIPLDNISYLFTRNGFHDRLSNTTVVKD
jgi:uncharacterized RDD family membrane protein YckC